MFSLPVVVRLRSRIWDLKKWWNLIVRRGRLYSRVFVERSLFQSAKNDKDFLLGLHLLRFASRLRSYQRIYLRIPDDGLLTNSQDRVNITLLMGATLFEGLQEFKTLQDDLRRLPSFCNVVETVKKLNRTMSGSKSDLSPVLEVLRNKVMFHFDRDVIAEAVGEFPEYPELDLVLGATEQNVDVVFPLVEDSLLSFVISKDVGTGTDLEKYENLTMSLLKYGEDLIDVHSTLALDLLLPYVKSKRSRRQDPQDTSEGSGTTT